jgi:hypothetical protein
MPPVAQGVSLGMASGAFSESSTRVPEFAGRRLAPAPCFGISMTSSRSSAWEQLEDVAAVLFHAGALLTGVSSEPIPSAPLPAW